MEHNREIFGALFKSIIGNFKSIMGSGLIEKFKARTHILILLLKYKEKFVILQAIGNIKKAKKQGW